jgi:hypothetical protein
MIDILKAMFEDSKDKYENTIRKLEEELRRRPEVLDIPPLQTVSTLVVDELNKKLKEKDNLLKILKVEFENKVKEEHESINHRLKNITNNDQIEEKIVMQDNKLKERHLECVPVQKKD